MARQRSLVDHNDAAADVAVVRDMAVGHQKVIITQDGGRAGFGAAVNGHKFTDLIAAADAGESRLIFKGKVLGGMTYDAVHMDVIVITQLSSGTDVDAGPEAVSGAQNDIILNNDLRTDFGSFSDPYIFSNNRAGMDV